MEKKKRGILGFMGMQQEIEPRQEERPVLEQIISVPISEILANPQQPRKVFYDEAIEELSGSIKEYGVLQPIILKYNGSGYTIIAGERRFRAAQMAGLSKIPAVVKSMEDQEAALISLVENVQREDLNFLEEARAYKKLMEDFGLTQVEIAEKVNKKQSTISNKIRILSLPEDIQDKLVENRLTDRVVSNNLNVKQTERLIEDVLNKKEEALRKRNKINYISYKIYLNTIRKAFGQIKEMEKNAKMSQEDKGDFLEVKILLPKSDRCFT